jgi:hypothetical protein
LNQKHGTGKYTYSCGDVFQGTWIGDKRKGRGKLTLKNGDVFEGVFDEESEEGSGSWAGWRVEGQMREGLFEGAVRMKKIGMEI